MVKVHIWDTQWKSWNPASDDNNVGHASLTVTTKDNKKYAYISWWPDTPAFGSVYPIRNRSFQADINAEGHNPNWEIEIDHLKEGAIIEWWEAFGMVRGGQNVQGPMLPYNFGKQNCCTIVHMALQAGGGDLFTNYWCGVWRPQTIKDYALSIKNSAKASRVIEI